MEYRKGRTNLSATIFVPYDCQNNCKFCTSKKDYKDCNKFSLNNIVDKISLLNKNDMIVEYVITGGEPFANIEQLKQILAVAQEKTVYINSTLPLNTLEESLKVINEYDCIRGINVSRHMGFDFKSVASIEDLDRINKPIRINTVIDNSFNKDLFVDFCNSYGKKKRDINLRADYRNITEDNLKTKDDISRFLMEQFDYISSEGCMVCNSEYYSVDDTYICTYHRGMEKSSVITKNDKCYVNDILIKQDGSIYKDWDCVYDSEFEKWVIKY